MAHWVNPAEAVEALARRHDLSGRFADYETCVMAAEETIMGRLVAGRLPTVASYVTYLPDAKGDIWDAEHRDEAVPTYFWYRWNRAAPSRREADWIVGDFKFEDGVPGDFPQHSGQAFDVRLDITAISGLVAPNDSANETTPPPQVAANSVAELQNLEAHRNALLSELAAMKAELASLVAAAATARDNASAQRNVGQAPTSRIRKANQGARLPEPALQSWWEWLDDETRALGHDTLLDLCAAAFPRNHISRDRIRDLAPNRKRGPKPFRGKVTA